MTTSAPDRPSPGFGLPDWRVRKTLPIFKWKFGTAAMQAYDSARFDPPAPLALVTVAAAERGVVIQQVPMLLDTGADVSLLPLALFESLVSPHATQYELEAFDGTRSTAPAVVAELEFLGKTFRGQFLLTSSWYGVLGRNVLNNLAILFDGPSRNWMEEE